MSEIDKRNSRSRLEAWDWKEEILDLVSKHETERKKFSILSQELKKASRYALAQASLALSISNKKKTPHLMFYRTYILP